MTCMITDSSFNINSTLIAQGLELKSKIYLKQLKELKIFYDADRYSAVKKILKTINDFMLKYLEDARTSSIAKMNLSNERKKMEQETQFIAEEVRYFKEHSTIKYEINKIRD